MNVEIGFDNFHGDVITENEEADFDVMDRATVKRISSVLLCTSSGKKPKDKVAHSND